MIEVVIKKCCGANAATETTVTGIDYLSVDEPTSSPSLNFIALIKSASVYSYENWIRFVASCNPWDPYSQYRNFHFWGPREQPDTGFFVYVGTTDAGQTPIDTKSIVATSRQDLIYCSTSSSLAITGTLTSSGDATNYFVIQLEGTSAAPGKWLKPQLYHYFYDIY